VLKTPLHEIREYFGLATSDDDPIADENVQPRIRGNCLMDISNRLKNLRILVVNTGNKTELALGYCTLYGDMTGGIGVLGDVSKLEVYKLARYVNELAGGEIVPQNVFEREPSPELKDGQVDPFDFDIVSPLVDEIIENGRSKEELISIGYPEQVVEDTYRRIRSAEYKRWQATPCIKVTPKAFGMGWKMPIVNRYSS
jgi:NAD+ synthase (glutamine-hydrolysing)